MLKGKFYTGLPEKMMKRSQGVDRQRTQFYWPDESDVEDRPTKNVKRTAAAKSSAPVNNTKVDDIEIKPKELFQKQLASGIEFYDNVNAKTPESRRRRFKKIENINLTNNDSQFVPEKKKLETFSSKIEFYDFVDDVKLNNNSSNNKKLDTKASLKKTIDEVDVKKKLPERSDSMKKRISFRSDVSGTATKSILKNSENKDNLTKETTRTPIKKGLSKKSLSKSVENIPRLAHDSDDDEDHTITAVKKKNDLASVVRDVRNLNLNEDKPMKMPVQRSRYADFDDNNNNDRGTVQKSNNKDELPIDPKWNNDIGRRDDKITSDNGIDGGRRPRENIESFDDYDNGHGDDRYSYEHPKINRKYSEDYYENRTSYRSDRNRRSPSRDGYDNRFDSRRNDSGSRYSGPFKKVSPIERGSDHYSDRSYQRRTPPSPDYNREASPRYNSRRSSNDFPINSTGRDRHEDIPSRNNRHYDDGDRYRNDRSYDRPSPNRYERRSPQRQYSPDRRRSDTGYGTISSQRHLKSTFSFGNIGYPPQQNRPVSVRQSAVQRVGVGLPDFQ